MPSCCYLMPLRQGSPRSWSTGLMFDLCHLWPFAQYAICVYWICIEAADRECFMSWSHVVSFLTEVTVLIILGALSRMWLHKVQINGFFVCSSWPYAHSVISCQGPDFLCRVPALSNTTGCQFFFTSNRVYTFMPGCDCSWANWSNAYVTSKYIWKDMANICLIVLHFPIIHRCIMRVSSHWLVPTH